MASSGRMSAMLAAPDQFKSLLHHRWLSALGGTCHWHVEGHQVNACARQHHRRKAQLSEGSTTQSGCPDVRGNLVWLEQQGEHFVSCNVKGPRSRSSRFSGQLRSVRSTIPFRAPHWVHKSSRGRSATARAMVRSFATCRSRPCLWACGPAPS